MKNLFLLFVILTIVSPVFVFEESQKVVMFWDSLHSFSKNEHSLANWLEGKTASAFINSRGEIEMTLDIGGFPHVLSSPELNLDCDSFDAIKITYMNLLDFAEAEKIKMVVGWLDDASLEYRKIPDTTEGGRFIDHSLEEKGLKTAIFHFKGHKNWKKGIRLVGVDLKFITRADAIEGKLLISSIELIKFY